MLVLAPEVPKQHAAARMKNGASVVTFTNPASTPNDAAPVMCHQFRLSSSGVCTSLNI